MRYTPSDDERRVLCALLYNGFLSIRADRTGKQCYGVADSLHNVPRIIAGEADTESARLTLGWLRENFPDRWASAEREAGIWQTERPGAGEGSS